MYSIPQRLGLECEEIEGALHQWACRLRSAIPGIVKSFDDVKQTCVVQIAIREYMQVPSEPTQLQPIPDIYRLVTRSKAIPPLEDVPIMMMSCFGWSMTLPITPGTECLLIFGDTCIDGWWQNSGVQASWDKRRHDLSDALALFGPWSQPFNKSDYSTDSVQIRSDDLTEVITLNDTLIDITAPEVTIESVSEDMTLTGNVIITGNLSVSAGATGTFTAQSGQIVTVEDGVIVSIV
jgi:Phage protein Gp138 N-terminal domain